MRIDLNCDLGESFGRYRLGNDEALMTLITSANVACGMHAGDPQVMQATVRLARQHGVAIGAHPGWPDLQGFGRREMLMTPDEAAALVLYQMGALAAVAKAEGTNLRHVKPHGALYNQAAKDRALADAIAGAIKRFDRELILMGLAGSVMIEAGAAAGLRVASEGFPDRRYAADGMLLSRKEAGAMIGSPAEVASHAVRLAHEGIDFGGRRVAVETLCLHGDNPRAAENAKAVREALKDAGIEVGAL